MSEKLTAVLRLYRLISAAALPIVPLVLSRRASRGKEDRERVSERRGEAGVPRPDGVLIWLHAASVGELASVLPLIERISSRGVNVLVTTGTVTSGGLAEQRLPRAVIHQYVPIDVPLYVRRFLGHWQPDLALFVESDLWPNMIIETSQRGAPMILVNARLSENSFHRWRHLPRTIGNLLARLDLCLAGTPDDALRLSDLGAPRVVTTGNLKLDVPAPSADSKQLMQLTDAIAGRTVIAAASTHAGEEDIIVAAHKRLTGRFPNLLTLIAPRHPDRGPSIAGTAAAAGLHVRLRSLGELPDATTDVYIADTMGELGLIYRVAPLVFMGGSLVPHGGQNPIEAAKLGAAIVHGPHVWNFAEIYAALDNAHGAELVADSERLTATFAAWLSDAKTAAQVAGVGRRTVEALGGALEHTLHSLDPYLMQLQLRQRAYNA